MTATFNLNKQNLITRALQTINVIDLDATPSNNEYAYASDILNLMLKKWEAQGINLWKRRLGYLFPSYNTNNYSLGSSGDNCTNSYIQTTMASGATNPATNITLGSTTGMSANDYIGITLDNGTRQWTTISSITSSTVLVLNTALTGSASSGNIVITYTTKINRPLRILRATIKDLSNNSESSMMAINYDEYFNMPIKSTAGRPNNFYYDRLLQGSTPYTGQLYLFPTPNNVNTILIFTYQESLADITNATDYADVPQEWMYALIFNLSCELAYHYGKFAELQQLQPKAIQELNDVQGFDSDDAPLRFSQWK